MAPSAFESRLLYFGVIQRSVCAAVLQVKWPHVHVFALLWPFSIDPTLSRSMIGRLCTMPACYLLIITFSKYDNRETAKYRNPGQDVSRKNGPYGHPIRCFQCTAAVYLSKTDILIAFQRCFLIHNKQLSDADDTRGNVLSNVPWALSHWE